jgi:hypothetical protein
MSINLGFDKHDSKAESNTQVTHRAQAGHPSSGHFVVGGLEDLMSHFEDHSCIGTLKNREVDTNIHSPQSLERNQFLPSSHALLTTSHFCGEEPSQKIDKSTADEISDAHAIDIDFFLRAGSSCRLFVSGSPQQSSARSSGISPNIPSNNVQSCRRSIPVTEANTEIFFPSASLIDPNSPGVRSAFSAQLGDEGTQEGKTAPLIFPSFSANDQLHSHNQSDELDHCQQLHSQSLVIKDPNLSAPLDLSTRFHEMRMNTAHMHHLPPALHYWPSGNQLIDSNCASNTADLNCAFDQSMIVHSPATSTVNPPDDRLRVSVQHAFKFVPQGGIINPDNVLSLNILPTDPALDNGHEILKRIEEHKPLADNSAQATAVAKSSIDESFGEPTSTIEQTSLARVLESLIYWNPSHEGDVTIAAVTSDQSHGQNRESKPVASAATKTPASRFCHVCTRSVNSVSVAYCCNIATGSCRKIICSKCAKEYGWQDVLDAISSKEVAAIWSCVHCREICPSRAQCATYKRINFQRRLRGKKRKLLKEAAIAAAREVAAMAPDSDLSGEGPGDDLLQKYHAAASAAAAAAVLKIDRFPGDQCRERNTNAQATISLAMPDHACRQGETHVSGTRGAGESRARVKTAGRPGSKRVARKLRNIVSTIQKA